MSKSLQYRSDIDTLRAIAVVSVITFHFNKSWLSGGFLGVDIFFVISGFLITLIMHREMNAGIFTFKKFYIRRIKRILPVFFVVLLSVVIAAAFLFSPDAYYVLGKTTFASILFSANLYQAISQGYFDPAQEEKPLLHIWSLSVEEQYYFLFPLFLLLLVRRTWRTQFIFLWLLIGLSLVASFLPSFGLDKYYLPHLRAFEMIVGSVTAVYFSYCHEKGYFPGARHAAKISLISIIVLGCCFVFYTPETPFFPGLAALLPCMATACLLYFNNFDHHFKKYFSYKPVIYIGLISYSLYLWHWPVLVFTRYISGDRGIPNNWVAGLVVLMLALSFISYHLIERPFRKKQFSFSKNILFFYAAPAAIVLTTFTYLNKSELIQSYYKEGLSRSFTSCHNNFNQQCVWGDETQKPKALMLGDSHADHYKTFIDYIGKKEGWSATLITADTCAYVDNYDSEVYRNNKSCRLQNQYGHDHIKEYPIVMLAMRWGSQIPVVPLSKAYDPNFFNKLENTLKQLSDKEAVYLFTDTPNIQYPGLQNYIRQTRFGMEPIRFQAKDVTYQAGNDKIKEIATRYDNVHVVDTVGVLPKNFIYDNKPMYSDLDHLNPYGGKVLAQLYTAKQSLLK
ncbi:acyltransferase family protein [Neisseria montereyensis]|uniref:Acyltransferase n=1 Tax=Neisseria montereyensis TaxID=2973938 RepID=A0ABT2FF94_9NEIS|nr:acyltransferase family protein [Neisseria montereyensis]MCS4534168.1 acyltransferase [Neisseria montereyensis]